MDCISTQREELKWKKKIHTDRASYNLVALIIYRMASDQHDAGFDTLAQDKREKTNRMGKIVRGKILNVESFIAARSSFYWLDAPSLVSKIGRNGISFSKINVGKRKIR